MEKPQCPLASKCEQLVTQAFFERYCMTKDFVLCRYYREKMVERRRPRDWYNMLYPSAEPKPTPL